MTDFVQVQTTLPDPDEADSLARELVEARLAGCVQVVGPLRSTYRWQAEVESADEWLCLIKARASQIDALTAAVERMHPYETPEIIACPIVGGNSDYMAWLAEATEPTR